jgi:hypothetical protein
MPFISLSFLLKVDELITELQAIEEHRHLRNPAYGLSFRELPFGVIWL